jgi:stage III sporulation protein AF
MEVITHWAGNIVSYLVFLTVLTGLLPAHKYEKYIRLFAGCILLLIVLKPLTDGLRLEERLNYLFTSLSFENEAGELKREMDEIEVRRRNMVLSQYEAEASKEAVRVAAEAGFSVEKADVELEKDPESEQFASVRSVTVYVAGSEAGMEAGMEAAELEENQSSMIEIEKIPPIEISLEQEQKQGEPAAAQAVSWMNGEKIWELQQRLASFYQVEADHVEVRMEP